MKKITTVTFLTLSLLGAQEGWGDEFGSKAQTEYPLDSQKQVEHKAGSQGFVASRTREKFSEDPRVWLVKAMSIEGQQKKIRPVLEAFAKELKEESDSSFNSSRKLYLLLYATKYTKNKSQRKEWLSIAQNSLSSFAKRLKQTSRSRVMVTSDRTVPLWVLNHHQEIVDYLLSDSLLKEMGQKGLRPQDVKRLAQGLSDLQGDSPLHFPYGNYSQVPSPRETFPQESSVVVGDEYSVDGRWAVAGAREISALIRASHRLKDKKLEDSVRRVAHHHLLSAVVGAQGKGESWKASELAGLMELCQIGYETYKNDFFKKMMELLSRHEKGLQKSAGSKMALNYLKGLRKELKLKNSEVVLDKKTSVLAQYLDLKEASVSKGALTPVVLRGEREDRSSVYRFDPGTTFWLRFETPYKNHYFFNLNSLSRPKGVSDHTVLTCRIDGDKIFDLPLSDGYTQNNWWYPKSLDQLRFLDKGSHSIGFKFDEGRRYGEPMPAVVGSVEILPGIEVSRFKRRGSDYLTILNNRTGEEVLFPYENLEEWERKKMKLLDKSLAFSKVLIEENPRKKEKYIKIPAGGIVWIER